MKLSEIATSDQLVLALAAQGFRKVDDQSQPTSEEALARERQGFFAFEQNKCPCCSAEFRFISVMPTGTEHGTDAGIDVTVNDDGTLGGWSFWESYAGTHHELDSTQVELEQIGPAVDAWYVRIEQGVD